MISHNLSQSDLVNIVKKDGWQQVGQKGSHLQFKHPTKPGKVTIPKEITRNIELSVHRQAGLK